MDILAYLLVKSVELGEDEFCKQLDIKTDVFRSWFDKSKKPKAPSFSVIQKALELWDPVKHEAVQEAMNFTLSDEGTEVIQNFSYVPPEWGTKKAKWKGRDICLCLPTYKPIEGEVFFNFLALVALYRQGIRIEHRHGDSMIARSRNHLAKRFMATDATWSVWLDSDMIFPMGSANWYNNVTNSNIPERFASIKLLERITGYKDRTIIGGCYWDRLGRGRLIAAGDVPVLAPIPSDTLQAVNFGGTGCLAVHRKVFEDVAAKFPETLQETSKGNECGFFTPIQTEHRMMGEDEAFQWRAVQAGHSVFLDLGIICGHFGSVIHGMPKTGSKI